MSYVSEILQSCPDLQLELDSYFGTCDASLLPDPAPLNEFLWSSLNTSGIQQSISPGRGKVRPLQLRYDQRPLESAVTTVDGCTPSCAATTKRGDLIAEYEIDTCDTLQVEEVVTADEMKRACRDIMSIVNKKMLMLMNVMDQKIATKMTGLAIALYGAWQENVQGTSADAVGNAQEALVISTKIAGSLNINPESFYDVTTALNQTNYCNGAFVVSGSTFKKYASLMQAGCCSAQGLDLRELMSQYGLAVRWDRRFENLMGINYAMALMPGALQPVYYNHATSLPGEVAGVTTGKNYEQFIMTTPMGAPVDVTLSDNCGALSIIIRATVDLKALPTDMFAPGDNMEGVTFVNKIKVVNT
jgi:hypothetical protein